MKNLLHVIGAVAILAVLTGCAEMDQPSSGGSIAPSGSSGGSISGSR